MSPYRTVAVAGATGNLGPSIIHALVAANYSVTVLSRTTTTNLPSTVKVVQVDYTSHASMVSALHGIDVLVSTVSNFGIQPALIDAAIEAGVRRFLPSEFGADSSGNEKTRALPVYADKVRTQEYLKKQEGDISHTLVHTGAFLDWGLEVGFLVNFEKGARCRIYDGGDRKVSTTLLADIGKAVVGVLQHPENTKNRAVYVQSAAVSQNELLALAMKHDAGLHVETEAVDLAELEKRSFEELQKKEPDVKKAVYGYICVALFGESSGGLWGNTDNELLGIKELSEEELEAVVARSV